MSKHSVLLICGLAAALPGLAYAGSKVTSADQTLQISASVSPNKASPSHGARGVVLKFHTDYESLNQGAQIKEATKAVIVGLPSGLKIHTDRAAVCKVSDMNKLDSSGNAVGPAACPAGSQVGSGTGTADARPAVPQPLQATIQMFNGIDDVNTDGSPRSPGVPAVILYAKTNIGATSILPFDIVGNTLELDFAAPAPGQSSLYHLQKVDVTFPNRGGRKAYITAPRKCGSSRHWKFTQTVTNYDGPSISATHLVRCRKR